VTVYRGVLFHYSELIFLYLHEKQHRLRYSYGANFVNKDSPIPFSAKSPMLTKKNENSDISKDSPIQI